MLQEARDAQGERGVAELVNAQDTLGETPLQRAVEASWQDGALLLLDAGAACELAPLSCTSPLHAAAYAGMVAVCQKIIDNAVAGAAIAAAHEATGAEASAAVVQLVRAHARARAA